MPSHPINEFSSYWIILMGAFFWNQSIFHISLHWWILIIRLMIPSLRGNGWTAFNWLQGLHSTCTSKLKKSFNISSTSFVAELGSAQHVMVLYHFWFHYRKLWNAFLIVSFCISDAVKHCRIWMILHIPFTIYGGSIFKVNRIGLLLWGYGRGWAEADIEAEVKLRLTWTWVSFECGLRLSCGWGLVEVEIELRLS